MPANEFSDLIYSHRQRHYRSARAFWKSKYDMIDISYERYAKVEKGDIPSLPTAIKIISALNIDESLGLHTWMRASLPCPRLKSYFTQEKDDFYAENRVILSSKQKDLLEECPIIYKFLTYLSLYADKKKVTPEKLSRDLKISLPETNEIIRKLKSVNLLSLRSKNIEFNGWFFVPDSKEFRALRRQNFRGFIQTHLEENFNEDSSFERITVRLVNPEFIEELKEKMHSLSQWFINAEDPSKSGVPYVVFIGGGEVDFSKGNIHWLKA